MARTPTTDRGAAARVAAAALVLAIGAAACTGDADDAAVTTASPTTTTTIAGRVDDGILVLGVYLPRTGPGAALGEPMIDAIEQAVRDINGIGGVLGQSVVLQIVDENSDTGMSALVEQGVDAIIGPASSRVALSQLGDVVQPGSAVVTCSPTATALALDDYPDNGYFFRTVASDSFQMAAIARRVANTGRPDVAVAYLDDPYGRPLRDAFLAEVAARGVTARPVGFNPDVEEFDAVVDQILGPEPGVVVVLGDADDGTRLLTELDTALQGAEVPNIYVNEALRNGRQTIQTLSQEFRGELVGVAPSARARAVELDGFFTANAVDCVNLIALSAVQAGSDSPRAIQAQMAAVSDGGRACGSFAQCAELLDQNLQINYNGLSGPVVLSSVTGDLADGYFEAFTFDDDGVDQEIENFSMP